MSISLLLADDHAVVRDGTRQLLERQVDMRVVGEAADGEEAVRLGIVEPLPGDAHRIGQEAPAQRGSHYGHPAGTESPARIT